MSVQDVLGDRIKAAEASTEIVLANEPIIVRLDGKGFSKFTIDQGFKKPFDQMFQEAMIAAVKNLINRCPEAKFGYTQSDEITLVIYNSNPIAAGFFGNRVQKIASTLASACTTGFNQYIFEQTGKFMGAEFDARVFNYPLSEINDPFMWRQADCFKNCTTSILHWGLIQDKGLSARATTKKLDAVSTWDRIDMIQEELGIDMKNYDPSYVRGVGVYKVAVEKPLTDLPPEIQKFNEGKEFVIRREFKIDKNLPLFKEDVDFISNLLK